MIENILFFVLGLTPFILTCLSVYYKGFSMFFIGMTIPAFGIMLFVLEKMYGKIGVEIPFACKVGYLSGCLVLVVLMIVSLIVCKYIEKKEHERERCK